MSIDDKLLKIINHAIVSNTVGSKAPLDVDAEALTQIHKAFKDEGYRQKDFVTPYKAISQDGITYYTGQEFYERWKLEVNKEFDMKNVYWKLDRAAQRAAGIE